MQVSTQLAVVNTRLPKPSQVCLNVSTSHRYRLLDSLTVNSDGCRVADSFRSHIFGHTSIVGRVRQPRGHKNQVAFAGHNEIFVICGLNRPVILPPGDHGGWTAFGRMAAQLYLHAAADLLGIWRNLEMLFQI